MENTTMTTSSLDLPAARQLRDTLASLLRREQAAMADFLVALADFDRRRGWEPLGHASLFAFLHVELRLSKGAAYVRFTAARLLQSFPVVLESIRSGQLCLSAVGELARVATPESFAEVLPRFFGCSSREAREIAAAIIPRASPPIRDQVTRISPAAEQRSLDQPLRTDLESTAGRHEPAASVESAPSVDVDSVRAHEPVPTHPARVAPTDDVEPLTADLRRLHVTVDRQFLKLLDAARDGLSHSIPGASTEQVLKAALELLLEKQARARGQVKRPRKVATPKTPESPGATPSPTTTVTRIRLEPRHRRSGPRETIPADVRRAVWERDGGRCTWPLDGGGRCGSTHQLEVDHVTPWARWGAPTEDGLRVLCHFHNDLAARQAFGARCVDRYSRTRPGPGPDRNVVSMSMPLGSE